MTSAILGIDHIQLAIPVGGEAAARRFYGAVLGLAEVAKPPELAGRGGAWFEAGPIRLHLGVEHEFQPARKAHPAFDVAGLAAIVARARAGGYFAEEDAAMPGVRRAFLADPFGNRIELIEAAG